MTSGGAIPENADYDVIAEPEDTFVGTVNEDFAIESLKGDVFLLGNTAWKIRRVESGRVRVEDAHGQPPTIPFWLGEAPGRTTELSDEVTEIREAIDNLLPDSAAAQEWVITESGVDPEAGRQLVAYIEEGKRVLGLTPSKHRVVAERFFDDSGGMQLVIHAPFGARINRAWGMALRKKICRSFDFELQAVATDDGLNFSLGPGLSMPVGDVFTYLKSGTIEEVLTQAILQAPIFGTRWRWNSTRALAILRHTGGKKVPAPLQRMRSDDLLAAVFPAQVACQDNAPARRHRTARPSLGVRDHAGLSHRGLRPGGMPRAAGRHRVGGDRGVRSGHGPALGLLPPDTQRHALRLPGRRAPGGAPCPGGVPAARPPRGLPGPRQPGPGSHPQGIGERLAANQGRRRTSRRPPDPRHPARRSPRAWAARSWMDCPSGNGWPNWKSAGRVYHELPRSTSGGSLPRGTGGWRPSGWNWYVPPTARFRLLRTPGRRCRSSPSAAFEGSREDAILALVRGWVDSIGPFTAAELSATLDLPADDVVYALGQLENEGIVLRGSYRSSSPGFDEFCDRRILARIHRSTIDSLRSRVEPVSPATFIRFLLDWQHVTPEAKVHGEGGLLAVIEQAAGVRIRGGGH